MGNITDVPEFLTDIPTEMLMQMAQDNRTSDQVVESVVDAIVVSFLKMPESQLTVLQLDKLIPEALMTQVLAKLTRLAQFAERL